MDQEDFALLRTGDTLWITCGNGGLHKARCGRINRRAPNQSTCFIRVDDREIEIPFDPAYAGLTYDETRERLVARYTASYHQAQAHAAFYASVLRDLGVPLEQGEGLQISSEA